MSKDGSPEKISLIAAVSQNGFIGTGNAMPWHAPTDLKFFKQKTLAKPLIMGRKTWEAIGERPLPGRTSIIVSRKQLDLPEGVHAAPSVDNAIALARDLAQKLAVDEIMIGGGAEIYRQTIQGADRIYLTRIQVEVDGDARFPDINENHFELIDEKSEPAGPKDPADMIFCLYQAKTLKDGQ